MEKETRTTDLVLHYTSKSNMKKLLAIIISIVIVLTAIPIVTTNVSASVPINAKTTTVLNLRSGRGLNYGVVKVLSKGTAMTITDRSDATWLKVKTSDGSTGYCHFDYITITTTCKTTDYVNFRKAPGTGSTVIKTIAPDIPLSIIRFNGNQWAQVKTNDGTTGYICTDYVTFINSSSSAAEVSKASEVESKASEASKAAEPSQVSQASKASQVSAESSKASTVTPNLKISDTSKTIAVGKSFTLTVTGITGSVKWTSSDASIAKVTSTGAVKGVSAGTVTIRATDTKTEKYVTCKVKVVKPAYNSISLSDTAKTVSAGSSFTLKATTNPSGGKVYFKSSNTSIATVSSSGSVKGVKIGTANITAYDSTGLITKTCKVTVVAKSSVKISESSVTVDAGSSVGLTITKSPGNLAVKWTSSDTSVAAVTDGVVSGLKAGTATITVSDAAGSTKSTCKVTVRGVSSGSVSLSRYSASTTAGKTIYINGYNGYYWGTSDSSIATVWDGFIETKKPGKVAIFLSDGSGHMAICAVTVNSAAPVKFAYSTPNSATIKSKVNLVAITDKRRTGVYFTINVGSTTKTVIATSKVADGNTFVWTATYVPTTAGTFPVTTFAQCDGKWSACADGNCDIYVADKSSPSVTGLSPLRASSEVISFIGEKEGFVSNITYDTLAYNLPTIGHGYVVWEGQSFYNGLTRNEGYALLVKAVNEDSYTSRVNEMLIENNAHFNQQQFDALVSFSYNLGTGWTYSSDLKDILMNSYGESTSGSTVTGTVTAKDGLNLRTGASTSSSVITVLAYKEKVTLLSTTKYNGVWYKVKTAAGKVGYCSGTYLSLSTSGSVVRDLNYVNRNALINEMLAYHHAGGVCYYGLLYRRVDELEMFLYNDYGTDGRSNKHNFPSPYCLPF